MARVVVPDEILRGLSASTGAICGDDHHVLFAGEEGFARVAAAEIGDARNALREAGLWNEHNAGGTRGEASYWEGMAVAAAPVPAAELIFAGELLPRPELTSALAAAGIEQDPGGVAVILTDDYLRPEVAAAVAGRPAALIAKPVGMELWLGPYLTGDSAGDSAGEFAELAYWLRGHRAERARISGWAYPPAPSNASVPWTRSLAAGWIGSALAMIASGKAGELRHRLLTLDVRTGRTELHRCGRRQIFVPGDWISPKTGIVSRIVHETAAFGWHHAAVEYTLGPLPEGVHRQKTRGLAYGSSGRGPGEARDKAVYEAVERFCSHYGGHERMTVRKYDAAACVHPNEMMHLDEDQRRRSGLDAFREEVEIAWMWGEPMGPGYDGKWIPAAMALLDYADETQPNFALPTSSGCAAGASLPLAARSAVREVVERDAVALWWYRQALRPAVQRLQWNAGGRTVEVLDITTEFGLPVCVAVGTREDGSDPVFGAGSGANLQAAANDAMRELAQVLTWREYWKDTSPYGYATVRDFLRGHPCPDSPTPAVADLPRMYLVNLSRPDDVGLPVVRVVAPELLSHRLGLVSRRLHDAPERLGWRCASPDAGSDTECPI